MCLLLLRLSFRVVSLKSSFFMLRFASMITSTGLLYVLLCDFFCEYVLAVYYLCDSFFLPIFCLRRLGL